jgi:hypothetical protein
LHRLFPRRRSSTQPSQTGPQQKYYSPAPEDEYDPNETPEAPIPDEPEDVPSVDIGVDMGSIDYQRLADAVYAKVEANADKFRGPPGPPGEVGPQGPQGEVGPQAELGPNELAAMTIAIANQLKNDAEFVAKTTGPRGPAGKDATIDVVAIAQAIESTLPPLRVQTINADGHVLDSESVPLGGTLNIHHRPVASN